jgi:hypothetical protein
VRSGFTYGRLVIGSTSVMMATGTANDYTDGHGPFFLMQFSNVEEFPFFILDWNMSRWRFWSFVLVHLINLIFHLVKHHSLSLP